jgi:hypothetical protein
MQQAAASTGMRINLKIGILNCFLSSQDTNRLGWNNRKMGASVWRHIP